MTGMTQNVEVVKVVNEEFPAIIKHNFLFHDIGESGKIEEAYHRLKGRDVSMCNVTVVPFHS